VIIQPSLVWDESSPFGGIPRNWKRATHRGAPLLLTNIQVPPSGGSLEIGN